jgi:hypothetical protein
MLVLNQNISTSSFERTRRVKQMWNAVFDELVLKRHVGIGQVVSKTVDNFETWAQSLLRLASSEGIRKDGEDAGGMDWSPRSSDNSSSFTDNVLDSRSTQRGQMNKKTDNGLDLSEDSVCKEIDSLQAFVGNVTQHLMADPGFNEMLRSSETADGETVHLEAASFESLHKHFEPPRVPRSGTGKEELLQETRFQEVYKMTEFIVFKPLLQVLGLLLMVIMSHRDQGIMIRLATMQSHYNPERAPQELFGISETFRSPSNWKSVVDSLQGIDELTLLPFQRLEQLQVTDSFLCCAHCLQ